MKDLLHKHIELELKLEADSRKIKGYAAVFGNVDSTGDIILPGAFAESISRRKPKMLYQHWSEKLIGMWDEYREDAKGLYVEGTLAKTPLGDEVYELARMGALDGMSIGYSPNDYEHDKQGIRRLKKVELWEVSLVTFPANEEARIDGVKQKPQTLREFEDFLREAGKFSREDATTIALRGFKALPTSREADAEAHRLISSIDKTINILRG